MSSTWMSVIRRSGRLLAVGALLAALVAVPAVVSGQTGVAYRAALIGANEVPPVASTATGTFTATLDEAAGTITWTLAVPSITNASAAHLHQGPPTVAGPVVLPLFAAPAGTTASSINVSGTSRQSDLSGPLAGNFAGFVAALKAGNIYVNAHTTQNPGGEIRGQIYTPVRMASLTGAAEVPPVTSSALRRGSLPRSATCTRAAFAMFSLTTSWMPQAICVVESPA